ncbi:MAG: proton-conducting transporter membrane subunit, partial [Pseudohongiellaceae bacterium]
MNETIITTADLLPLLPLIVTTGVAVVVMLLVAMRRNHTLACASTIAGLAIALITTVLTISNAPQQVTPLLIIDQFSLFSTVVVLIIAAFIAVFSYPYLYLLHDEVEEFYLLLIVATIGAIVMVSSNHFISAFLGIETLSIALYAMVAYPLHSKNAAKFPLEAGIKYLVLSAVATAVMLFGIALLYSQTGSLAFINLVQANIEAGAGFTTLALLLITAGFAFKLSLVPFHIWTPDVYEGAPLPATAFLATTGKAAMFV